MKKFVQIEDLEALSLGATLLGSGGGGDPHPDLMRTKELFSKHGLCQIIDQETLADDDLVVPVAFMGAPLVSTEKLPSGRECLALLEMIKKHCQKEPKALVAAEIGGSNAFTALALGAMTGLPVLDGDTLGRAFPELHMSSCALHGIIPSPAFFADALGNSVVVHADSAKRLEFYARSLCEAMGSSVACALYLQSGAQAKKSLVANTLSQAIDLGRQILSKTLKATHLGKGYLVDIQQEIQGGFLTGKVEIVGSKHYEVVFQNEYLLARSDQEVLATTPDIIAILEQESGYPLAVERLKFGLAVEIVALPAPNIWQSKQALQIVGPQTFGYDCEYKAVSR